MVLSELLRKNDEYFENNRDEFVEKYHNKFAVIINQSLAGVYDDYIKAYKETIKTNALGTFLIQLCASASEEADALHFANGNVSFESVSL